MDTVSGYWHTATANRLEQWGYATSASVSTWMGDCISMSISVNSPSDETLNQGPVVLLLRRQYEFPFGIDIKCSFQFSNFFSIFRKRGAGHVFQHLVRDERLRFESRAGSGGWRQQ